MDASSDSARRKAGPSRRAYSKLSRRPLGTFAHRDCTAVGLVVSTVWDEGLAQVVWDPIAEDASETGDAGYNP